MRGAKDASHAPQHGTNFFPSNCPRRKMTTRAGPESKAPEIGSPLPFPIPIEPTRRLPSATGAVRLAVLDTIEPGAAALNILVLSPPEVEMGGRQCRIVSLETGIGFFGATLDGMTAAYDPAVGLIFGIPVQLFVPETGMGRPARLRLTVNQATGQIGASLN